jgi:transcriptional regulator with XRE-family HTH domain
MEQKTDVGKRLVSIFFHGDNVVTIYCKLRLLLAKANVERTKQGKAALSLRRLAEESGVSLSVLASLHTGKSQRIDYMTIDHLLTYFNQYFHVTAADLLGWEQPEKVNAPAS